MKARPSKSHRRVLLAIVIAVLAAGAPMSAAAENSRIASQYAGWAGGKANADNLVKGLRNGSSVMLSTIGPDRVVSLAGFTPPAALSDEEIAAALADARAALSRLGIQRPSADQIQAAIIGGEVKLANGATRLVRGAVSPAAPVATTGDVVATR